MKKLSTVWCEWDIGQHNLVFADEHVAERWLRNNSELHRMAFEQDAADFDEFYQEIVDECLIGIHDVELIE
jgi:hypothetical protein